MSHDGNINYLHIDEEHLPLSIYQVLRCYTMEKIFSQSVLMDSYSGKMFSQFFFIVLYRGSKCLYAQLDLPQKVRFEINVVYGLL